VQIAFCEADVLDAFDDWRRAVGVSADVTDPQGGPDVEEPLPAARSRKSLASQIDAMVARLTVLRGSDKAGPVLGSALDAAVRDLDALRADAARARGDAREALLERVTQIEDELVARALQAVTPTVRDGFEREADAELEPFRSRMSASAYAQSRHAAVRRLVRVHFGLPTS
jgi:hypothetical protein